MTGFDLISSYRRCRIGVWLRFRNSLQLDWIFWICFSTAEDSLPDGFPQDALKKEFKQVLNFLKISDENSLVLNYRVRKLSEVRQEILDILVKTRNSFQPNIVIGPSLNDFHQDHQVVANEMIRAFKSTASIISYELPWNHVDFKTQLFSKIDESDLQRKLKCSASTKLNLSRNDSISTRIS